MTDALFDADRYIQPEFTEGLHPPYSILDAAGGWWQTRRAEWRGVGIEDTAGRDATSYRQQAGLIPAYSQASGNDAALRGGQSGYSAVLAELLIRWHSNPGDLIYDPFAGGPTRGLVAALCRRRYHGGDLSPRQVEANRQQAARFHVEHPPAWSVADAATAPAPEHDLLFSCPPYHNLERYSDDPADLSNLGWDDFTDAYRQAIAHATSGLADDRFAVWTVGEIRGPDGHLRGFVPLTVEAFQQAGLAWHNEFALRQPLVSAQMRVNVAWPKTCRNVRVHQTVLVFLKGDARQATQRLEIAD